MENYRDTAFNRFSTVIWGGALILAFGIAAIIARPILHKDQNVLSEIEAEIRETRLANKNAIFAAQKAALTAKELGKGKVQLPPEDVFAALAPQLLAAKPKAIKTKEQKVPEPAAEDTSVSTEAPADADSPSAEAK